MVNIPGYYFTYTVGILYIVSKEGFMNAKRIKEILLDCLFKDNEIVDGKPICEMTKGKGIINIFGFHKNRLTSYQNEIIDMLYDLPESFITGDNFVNAHVDRHGNSWGEHQDMSNLFALADALDLVIMSPRSTWDMTLGVPLIIITTKAIK